MSDAEPNPVPTPDRFTVLRLHALGGLGQVSLARDERLKRQVALKEIRPDKRHQFELRRRFLNEAEITGQLEHPGVVPIYDLDHDANGQVRYVMRFVQGKTLRQSIQDYHQQPTQLEFRELLQRFVSICKTMEYAHRQGIIHRDLKPANILLGDFGETLIVDWGLAKRLGATVDDDSKQVRNTATASQLDETTDFHFLSTDDQLGTQDGQVLGTLAYMAPEQARGDVAGTRSPADIYGLGAILYELLTGQAPHQGKPGSQLLQAISSGSLRRPREIQRTVPRGLEAICLQAMSREPSARYSSAVALASDIERWLADEPVSALPDPWHQSCARWMRRHRSKLLSIAGLLVTALVVGAISTWMNRQERERVLAVRQVNALLEAAPTATPQLLETIALNRDDVKGTLNSAWNDTSLPDTRRARAGLALLRAEPESVFEELQSMMLQQSEPNEFLLLRDQLASQASPQSVAKLWRQFELSSDPNQSFRLLVALAAFDSKSQRWSSVSVSLVRELLNSNSLHLGAWTTALTPISDHLIPPVINEAHVHRDSERGRSAVQILLAYASHQPESLVAALLQGSTDQFVLLWATLQSHQETRERLLNQLDAMPSLDVSDEELDDLASRQANAAIGMLLLGHEERLWPLLRASVSPRIRTYLIHRLAAVGVPAEQLLRRLELEADESIRISLWLSLGEYRSEQLSTEVRQEVIAAGRMAFQQDPNAGVHSAVDWLLRRLGEPVPLESAQAPASNPPASIAAAPTNRLWFNGPEGYTFAVIQAPLEFYYFNYRRSSKSGESVPLEKRVSAHRYAMATRKVTLAQYRRFLLDVPDDDYPYSLAQPGDAAFPAVQVTWIQAVRYCRWLSELDGLPETEMCYPKLAEINQGLELPADYQQRTGYRLPTEEEWECACRAGTNTRFSFGSDERMLKHYGWHAENSRRRLRDVGLLKPSDFGLFDMYGLACEFTSQQIRFKAEVEERIVRGSHRFQELEDVETGSDQVGAKLLNYLGNECGFRVVRSLPSTKLP